MRWVGLERRAGWATWVFLSTTQGRPSARILQAMIRRPWTGRGFSCQSLRGRQSVVSGFPGGVDMQSEGDGERRGGEEDLEGFGERAPTFAGGE